MRKFLLIIGVLTTLATSSMSALGIIVGEAGEALLVPWVYHGDEIPGPGNTVISVAIPAAVGFDAIANSFTAPHVTPTNSGPTPEPPDPDLVGGNAIHWYWFDSRGQHRRNGRIPVTPNDLVWIDWLEISNGSFAGEDGYMVIGTETARSGAAADFALLGEAWVDYVSESGVEARVPIPVLPMNDGPDGDSESRVSISDNVKYGAGGIPRAVSPLYSGIRTNRSDGVLDDTTVFNLSLGTGDIPALHLIWLDRRSNDGSEAAALRIERDRNHSCSESATVEEGPLQLLVERPSANLEAAPCGKSGDGQGAVNPVRHLGYATYSIPEYIDTGINEPESAGVAFSITTESGASGPPRVTSSPALARGTFK